MLSLFISVHFHAGISFFYIIYLILMRERNSTSIDVLAWQSIYIVLLVVMHHLKQFDAGDKNLNSLMLCNDADMISIDYTYNTGEA